jgi:plasmid stabilization system protein ParE
VKLRYSWAARRGLLEQLDWLAQRSPASAQRAADEIDYKLSLLEDFPLAAPLVAGRHRELFIGFGRDGFIARYRIEGDVVLVVQVFHGRQSRR